jgi:hypothetical protein
MLAKTPAFVQPLSGVIGTNPNEASRAYKIAVKESGMAKPKANQEQSPDGVAIYQFRWYLKGISPLIWRRVLIRSDSTLADLHYVIQMAMNWSNFYLHQFQIYGKRYAVWRSSGPDAEDAEEIRLDALQLRLNERFVYEYSFFEWWQHEIRLEQILPYQPRKQYPICTGGGRAAPREDSGGAEGFMRQQDHFSPGYMLARLLEIAEPIAQHQWPDDEALDRYEMEQHDFEYWLHVEQLDRKHINQRLKWYAQGDEQWVDGLEVL